MLCPALAWTEANAMVRFGFTALMEAVCCATPAAKLAVPRWTTDASPSSTACQVMSDVSSSVC